MVYTLNRRVICDGVVNTHKRDVTVALVDILSFSLSLSLSRSLSLSLSLSFDLSLYIPVAVQSDRRLQQRRHGHGEGCAGRHRVSRQGTLYICV